jgi:hypothetical protein
MGVHNDRSPGRDVLPTALHGIINANSPTVSDEIHAPMGGVPDSGWGRAVPTASPTSPTSSGSTRPVQPTVGLDHVLFGTDYPYLRRDLAVSTRQRVLDSPELGRADRTNILGATASKLIPRLGSRHPTPGVDSAAR